MEATFDCEKMPERFTKNLQHVTEKEVKGGGGKEAAAGWSPNLFPASGLSCLSPTLD